MIFAAAWRSGTLRPASPRSLILSGQPDSVRQQLTCSILCTCQEFSPFNRTEHCCFIQIIIPCPVSGLHSVRPQIGPARLRGFNSHPSVFLQVA